MWLKNEADPIELFDGYIEKFSDVPEFIRYPAAAPLYDLQRGDGRPPSGGGGG